MIASDRRNLQRIVVSGVVGAVVGAMAVPCRPVGEGAGALALAPDASLARYRYPIATVEDASQIASTIAALESRIKDLPDPFAAAELADLYYRRAQLEGDRRDYATSEAMAKRSLELLAKPNGATLTLAKLKNAHHEFREAIEFAHKQLESKASAGAYIAIATAHLALGELPAAMQAAHRAIALKPDTNGYSTRALVLQAQGRDVEAVFDFGRAVALEEPGDKQGAAKLRALWGRFLLRRGEYAGSAIVLDEAVRIVPGFPLALACRGELALRTGNPADARKFFEEAFRASRQVRYLIDQARAQEFAGDRTGADALRALVEKLVRGELAEDGLGHRLDLIEVLIDRGRSDQLAEALTLAREELTRRSSSEVRYQLARVLARTGHADEAIEQVQAALANGTREAQLYELAAQLEQQHGNTARAAMYRREAIALDPADSGWRKLGLGMP